MELMGVHVLVFYIAALVSNLTEAENLALGKPTVQGSTYNGHVSDHAVDGNYDGNINAGSCTHTATWEKWWRVDLKAVYSVYQVILYNRFDVPERLDNARVEGFLTDPDLDPSPILCGFNPGPSGDIVTVECGPGFQARYIQVMSGTSGELTLCEVEVLALVSNLTEAENVALGKPTVQGSTYNGHVSDHAVDGNYDGNINAGSCTCTATWEKWWRVDLEAVYSVYQVILYNRGEAQERLDNARVEGFLTNPYLSPSPILCGVNPGPSGDIVTLECGPGFQARYIQVMSGTSGELTLCEVEVLGEIVPVSGCPWTTVPVLPGKRMATSVELGNVQTRVECAHLCKMSPNCDIAGYNHVTTTCTAPILPFTSTDDANSDLIGVP